MYVLATHESAKTMSNLVEAMFENGICKLLAWPCCLTYMQHMTNMVLKYRRTSIMASLVPYIYYGVAEISMCDL